MVGVVSSQMPKRKWRSIAKGVLAILIWIALYSFVKWFHAVGWLGYLSIAVPLAVALWIVSKVSKRARTFLTRRLPYWLEQVFGIYEDKMGWIVYFWFVLMYGGIIYFILFSPYGLLCHLGLRPCGQ
jgi:hypothetical protein